MVNPAGTAEMWTFRKLGLNEISTEKAIISTQKEIISNSMEKAIFSTEKEISCPRHLTRAYPKPESFFGSLAKFRVRTLSLLH